MAILGDLRVIHVPGHTPGSIVFYQPEQQLLFCGDVLFNGNPFTGRGGLQMPPRFFSVDPAQTEVPAKTICFNLCNRGTGPQESGGEGKSNRT